MTATTASTALSHKTTALPERASDATAIIQMIERVALNPNVDIDKMERLLQMQERVLDRNEKQAFNEAMSSAQADMRPIAVDSVNPQTRSKYASYAALDRAMRPIYTKHGFALSFNTEGGAPEQCVRVICLVSHKDGHERKYQIDMPADGKGAKGGDVMSKTHATGSGMTYGQRYLLKLIFNIAVSADDDGNGGRETGELLSQTQIGNLLALIKSTGANEQKFCAYMKVAGLNTMFAAQFDAAVAALNRYGAKRKAVS